MDEYKHCMNCIITRAEMVKLAVTAEHFGFEKGIADKEYEKILQWFKETYELKRRVKR